MFEDSTFESNGTIRTRSRGWMAATFILNGSILVALILIPLVYPEALPRQFCPILITVPPPPPAPVAPQPQQPNAHPFHGTSEFVGTTITAPRTFPRFIVYVDRPEQPAIGPMNMGDPNGMPNGIRDVFSGSRAMPDVRPDVKSIRLPSSLAVGLLIHKVAPVYPPIAVAARQQGTVVLAATISKGGTIANLHVVSGPAMLQQAALDAVARWAYRPYLLNGQPVEVETTVNVVFTLDR